MLRSRWYYLVEYIKFKSLRATGMSRTQGSFALNGSKQIIITSQIPVEPGTGWQQSQQNWQKPFCQQLSSFTCVLFFNELKILTPLCTCTQGFQMLLAEVSFVFGCFNIIRSNLFHGVNFLSSVDWVIKWSWHFACLWWVGDTVLLFPHSFLIKCCQFDDLPLLKVNGLLPTNYFSWYNLGYELQNSLLLALPSICCRLREK